MKHGLRNDCKTCNNSKRLINSRTIIGTISTIYSAQRYSSKKRNHIPPNYSKAEFVEWALSQSNFKSLYLNWVKSDYDKWLKPSADRQDSNKPYTLDNLRLMTWKENSDLGHADSKNGVLIIQHASVIQSTIEGKFIAKYYSMASAFRITGAPHGGICQCCKGTLQTSGGFKWEYA